MCRDTLPVCQVRYALTSLLLSPFSPLVASCHPFRPLSHCLASLYLPRFFFRRCFVLVCTRSDTIRVDANILAHPRRCIIQDCVLSIYSHMWNRRNEISETLLWFFRFLQISVIKWNLLLPNERFYFCYSNDYSFRYDNYYIIIRNFLIFNIIIFPKLQYQILTISKFRIIVRITKEFVGRKYIIDFIL